MIRVRFRHDHTVPEAVMTGSVYIHILHVASGKTGFDLILVGFRENIVFRSPQHQNIPMDISDKSSAVELQKPIHQIFPGDHRHLPYVFQCRSPERFRFIPHSCPLL